MLQEVWPIAHLIGTLNTGGRGIFSTSQMTPVKAVNFFGPKFPPDHIYKRWSYIYAPMDIRHQVAQKDQIPEWLARRIMAAYIDQCPTYCHTNTVTTIQ